MNTRVSPGPLVLCVGAVALLASLCAYRADAEERSGRGPLAPTELATQFRAMAAADISRALKATRLKSEDLFGLDRRRASAIHEGIWPYFFSSALTLSSYAKSTSPVTSFYNPFVGVILSVQWHRTDEGWRPARSAAVSDQAFLAQRTTLLNDVPAWVALSRDVPMEIAVQRAGLYVLGAMKKRHPPGSSTAWTLPERESGLALDLAELGCVRLMSWLTDARKAPQDGSAAPWKSVRRIEKVLRDKEGDVLEAMLPPDHGPTASNLLAMPGDFSKGFRAAVAVPTGRGWLAFYVHPGFPCGFYSARMEAQSNGKLALQRLYYAEYATDYRKGT